MPKILLVPGLCPLKIEITLFPILYFVDLPNKQCTLGNFVFCGLKCLSRHVDPLPGTRVHQSQRDKPQRMHNTCPTKANQSPPTRSIEDCQFQRVSGISGYRRSSLRLPAVLVQDDYFHNFNSFIRIGGFLLRCD